MRLLGTVLVVVLLAAQPALAAGVAPATAPATDPADGVASRQPRLAAGAWSVPPQQLADGADPADPESDVLGWENGYWHDEPIAVDQSDGLNESELDAVVGRSMARVEYLRGLEFDRTPPVEIITREEFRRNTRERYRRSNVSTENRLHQNVKFEALFMVGESTDYLAVDQQNTASGVLGFYVSGNGSNLPGVTGGDIVIVSDNETTPQIDEITLSQELFHALQDRQLNTTTAYNITTEEDRNAVLGVIEGDGNYVDYLYEQRCGAGWDCLRPSRGGGNDGGDRHVGIALFKLVPYSDGPPFVAGVRDEGGWDAVNRLYDEPPASTEQLIHPELYRRDPPTRVRVEDRSSGDWRVLDLPRGVNYASFGEAGAFVMLWYPSYQTRSDQVVPLDIFGPEPPDLYDYDHRYTAGWDGDRLVPYVTDDSVETNETGYVWKLEWDSPTDAREFASGYRELLRYHGAERVGADTYVVPEGRSDEYGGEFGDAFHLLVDRDTVTIVNAPTTADLASIHDGVVREPVPTSADATPAADGATTGATGVSEPGFGVGAAVLAILGAVLLLRSRD